MAGLANSPGFKRALQTIDSLVERGRAMLEPSACFGVNEAKVWIKTTAETAEELRAHLQATVPTPEEKALAKERIVAIKPVYEGVRNKLVEMGLWKPNPKEKPE